MKGGRNGGKKRETETKVKRGLRETEIAKTRKSGTHGISGL